MEKAQHPLYLKWHRASFKRIDEKLESGFGRRGKYSKAPRKKPLARFDLAKPLINHGYIDAYCH